MTKSRHQPRSALREFLESEAAGGILLMIAAILAMLVANSPWSSSYFDWLHEKAGPLSVHHWIIDALMAIFFFMIGLEIKREIAEGELSTKRKAALADADDWNGQPGKIKDLQR